MMTWIDSPARILTVVALVCLLGACRPHPDTLDEVIVHNTAAVGGRSAIEGIQSIEILLHITDPDFQVDATYRAMRPGWMRIDVMAGGEHVYTEAFDGNRGWQWKGKGDIVPEGPEATAALRHGVELPGKLFGLHELRRRGHQLTLAARELISGTNYYVLQTKLSDGYTTSLYIDPNNWLITRRRDVRPLHVDIDPRPTTIETLFSDFRTIGGVQFPFVSADIDLKTGKVLEKVQVNRITVNPGLVRALFQQL